MTEELAKKPNNSEGPIKFGPRKSLAAKLAEQKELYAQILKELNPLTVPNRIGGILDDSGSTAGECWNNEVQAFSKLLDQSNYQDTSYLLYKLNNGLVQPLTCDYALIKTKLAKFSGGCTPLAAAMAETLKQDITRAFAISDGEPDSTEACFAIAELYKEKGIKIDTIFVSSPDSINSSGIYAAHCKDTMRKIATITGGIFMCFDNLGNFSHAIAYLSPAFRDSLEDKKVRLLLGSNE